MKIRTIAGIVIVLGLLAVFVVRTDPIRLYAEWYDNCPQPPDTATPAPIPPTYTPLPTHTPRPTPTCRPTWTPPPTATPYPTQPPLPTATEYPTQPPWGTATPTVSPVNPDASEVAGRVLGYIASLPARQEKRVISGQMTHHGQHAEYGYNEYVVNLQEDTGHWVALAGFDYNDVWAGGYGPWSDPSLTNEVAIEWWNSGGFVTFSYQPLNPFTNASPWGDCPKTLGGNVTDLLNTEAAGHEAWMTEVDKMATGLAELRDAGVVVLFRPFPEMNGGWFWWGHADWCFSDVPSSYLAQQTFVDMWRYLFNYLAHDRGLNNLLWVYTPNVQEHEGWMATDYYYPGDDYVDIVGLTYYLDSLDSMNANGSYDKLVALGKPLCIGEMGPDREDGQYDYSLVIEKIRDDCPEMVYFLAWVHHWAIINNQGGYELLSDPWVITRADVSF